MLTTVHSGQELQLLYGQALSRLTLGFNIELSRQTGAAVHLAGLILAVANYR